MITYVIRRLLLMFPTLLGITLVVFMVMAAAPGGITAQGLVAGQDLEPQAKQALEEYYNRRYGLDQPAPMQYLRWLNNISPIGFTFDEENQITGFSLLKGSDLGDSFRYGRPVMDLLQERIPITLLLNVIAIPIIYLVAIVIGMRAATQRGKSFDIGSNIFMLGLWSIPTMLAGVLLIGFFASNQYWHWFPTAGLNRREAIDMAFMPHWTNLTDVLTLFLCMAIGIALFIWFSEWCRRTVRTAIMAGAGIMLGIAMANVLPGDGFSIAAVLLGVGLGGTLALIGYMEYAPLRSATMGFIGLLLGVLAGISLMQGDFIRGFLFDRLWHLALPVLCLSYGGFAFLARLTRTSVLENLQADYARTARAKGVKEKDVLWRHVFRNSLLPLITVSASLLPSLLAGSVIVETIFSIDGMGKLAVEAVKSRDRELVLSITLVSGLLTLIGYLLADLFYAITDPRVSYE